MPNKVKGGVFSGVGEIKGDAACAIAVYYACVNPGGLWYVPGTMVQYLFNNVIQRPVNNPFMCPTLKKYHILSIPQFKGNTGCLSPGENLVCYLNGTMNFEAEKARINDGLRALNAGEEISDEIRKWSKIYSGREIPNEANGKKQNYNFTDSEFNANTYIIPDLQITIKDFLDSVQKYMDNIPTTDPCKQLGGHPIEIQRL